MHSLLRRLFGVNALNGTLFTSSAMAVTGTLIRLVFLLHAVSSSTETMVDYTDETTTLEFTTVRTESSILHSEQHQPLLNTEDTNTMKSQKEMPGWGKFADLIPADYSIHDPPPLIDGNPVPVRFSVSVKNIPDINELKQMLSVEMNLRIYWQDKRLENAADLLFKRNNVEVNHPYLSLNPVVLSKIWVPDIYTDYAKSVTTQRILSPPISLRIYPNATIRYSSRIMMEMSCPMEFRKYPADTQRCELRLESYGFTREELYFSWVPEGRALNIGHRLAHFDFGAELINDKEDVNFLSGSYPAISMCLIFQRRLNYHLLQTYIPSGLFVVVSWLSFLVPRECAPGRLAICMTTLLTLTAMFAAVRQNTPSVSYIKALDIWMVGCIIFVFFALAEFAFILRLDKHLKVKERKVKKTPSTQGNSNSTGSNKMNWSCVIQKPSVGHFRFISDSPDEQGNRFRNKKWNPNSNEDDQDYEAGFEDDRNQKHRRKYKVTEESITSLRRRTEALSAAVAPIGFIIFNICYWSWLLLTSSHVSTC